MALNDGAIERWLEWLSDLASYRPSDFLMFSPRAYWRLFELQNEAWWPLPLLLPMLGLALLGACIVRGGATAQRAGAIGLAACAGFVSLAFMVQRYAAINWAATAAAVLWAAQGLLLAMLAWRRTAPVPLQVSPVRRRVAAVLALWALLGHPLLAPLQGRPLAQAEVFGLAPDPTTLAILAWLLSAPRPVAGCFVRVWQAAWCVALACGLSSAAMLALLGGWQFLPLLAAMAVAVAAVRRCSTA